MAREATPFFERLCPAMTIPRVKRITRPDGTVAIP
jgi:hypothetical protein